MMNDATEKFSLPLRCRMSQGYWFVVPGIVGAGMFMLLGPIILPDSNFNKSPAIIDKISEFSTICLAWLFAALLISLGLWLALRLLRYEVIADEDGLRWRFIRGWQRASWNQVHDYYYAKVYPMQAIIETDYGNIAPDSTLKNLNILQDVIQLKATNARTTKWDVLGARPELDWPRTFEYKPEKHRRGGIVSVILAVLWVAGFVYAFWSVRGGLADIWQYSGAVFSILGIVMFILVFSFAPMFAWIVIATQHEMMARRAQNITIATAGLIYQNGAERIECAWNEVLDYYRDPMAFWSASDDRFVIVTPQGEWDFTLIEDRFLLQEIIKRYATSAKYSHWREYHPRREALAAQGERVFTYRTRELRPFAICVVPVIMTLIVLGFFLPADETSKQPPPNRLSFLIVMSPYALCAATFCWMYLVGEIRIVEQGIRQRGISGKKFLAWNEVKQLRRIWSGAYEVVGENTCIGFRPSIADVQILRAEITRRATNAELLPSWTEAEKSELGT
jgi:uncharacterized membrane protein YjgN (DUF898 family)